MNFLIIHNRYSRIGGEESVVAQQYDLLGQYGHNVILYERSYDEIYSWRTGKIGSLFSSLYNRRSVREIRKVIVEHNIDIALVHNLFPVVSPAVLHVLHQAGVKVIMMLHNFRLVCPTGLFFRNGGICEQCGQSKWREWQCVAHRCEGSLLGSTAFALRSYWARKRRSYTDCVDVFCAMSNFQSDKISEYGIPNSKIRVLPNPVRLQKVVSSHTTRVNFIGFVGRFSEEKGAYLLLEAAKRLPQVDFKVAGPIMIPIQDKPSNIEFVGFLNRSELDDFYLKARAIVSTSLCYETFGLVIAEAMAQGAVGIVPCLAAMPELVDFDHAGITYKNGSVDSLCKSIELIVSNNELVSKLSERGKQHIEKQYSQQSYYRGLISICEDLLSERES